MSNFTTTSPSIAEIFAFYKKKDGRKLPSPTLPINIMRNAYLCPANIDVSVYVVFARTKTKCSGLRIVQTSIQSTIRSVAGCNRSMTTAQEFVPSTT